MPKHHEIRQLPYSAQQMYELVADIGKYPQFLPWVIAMRIKSDSERETIADMIVGFKSLRESFTSRVFKGDKSIRVEYIDGPLKYLKNDWEFTDRIDGGCDVDFKVEFAFKNRVFEKLAGQFFEAALSKMTGAFVDRAHILYGNQTV